MKILFVYTDINTMGLGSRTFHLGISMISAMLKQNGHNTNIVCMYNKFDLRDLVDKITDYRPDIIALTSDTTQLIYIKKILQNISQFNIFTVLGGVHASLCPSCLEELSGLDAVCIGEGEFSMLDLVNNFDKRPKKIDIDNFWFKVNGEIIKNKTRPFINNLDVLPFADRELFDYQKIIDSEFGRASFMLSRGCPFACTYCASPSMGKLQDGKYVRFMSVGRAIDELKYLMNNYRFKSIFFADDTFTLDKKYVLDFCREYKRHINIPFEVNSRVEVSSLETFQVLKDAGCFNVHIGIESGNEEFRKTALNRKMSNEQIINAFKNAKEAGLQTKSYNIVGFPHETPEIHKATIELNRTINPNGHVCYIFQPYPGTRLYDICKEENLVDSYKTNNSNVVSRRESVLNMSQFTPKEIIEAHRNFSFLVYKGRSLRKALIYKLYYSRYGEALLRIFSPVKNILRKIVVK